MAVYTVSLPRDLDEDVRDIAKKRRVSPEEAIRQLTRERIEMLKGGK
jgi:metal-responsive CopG/Arc/MetJ family transcriptional regulator